MASDSIIKDVSFTEKLADIKEKLGMAATIIGGALPGGEFQMTTAKVRGVDMRVFKNLPPALGDVIRPKMKQHGSKPWIIYEDESYTFSEALQQVDALSAELHSGFGVNKGDSVSIAMRNLPEFLFSFLGITVMGAVAVPLNALWKTEELEYSVKDSGSKVIIGDPERLKLCAPFQSNIGVQTILCRGSSTIAADLKSNLWQDVIASGKTKPAPSTKGVDADDDCMIMYTSGSTGHPKGVVHTQRSVGTCMAVGSLVAKMIHVEDSSTLMAVPLFHITALANVFLWTIPAAEKLVMMHKWDAGKALQLTEKLQIKKFTGVPTMVRDILEHPEYSPERLASMKSFAAGGAPVPPAQVKAMREKAKKTTPAQGYGLTETMGGCVSNRGVDYLKRPTSAGRPLPFLVKAVVKDPETGKVLPDGQRGELCIQSALVMKGYKNRQADTEKVIDSEGFFHTGDIARIDGGFVYILDRLKDIIIRGGENIDCSEVEAALYQHPSVRECCVFGLPDERLGEVVGSAVFFQEGKAAPSQEELSKHTEKLLAKFKVPEAENIFVHTEELPKGATGKIAKKDLREKYAQHVKSRPPRSRL
eukprot:TRINITY_DN25039_c0_g1_i1.p1 TRINITY_DN25039_c0_g1~~TRINITY_DN25039_c0_g1_i1.p1  ORF type:complete len:589 (+),score=133.22 TRINITY_DN25039_c0_g1_i1:71-1837(+)